MAEVLRIGGDVLAALVVLAFVGVGGAVWLHGAERPAVAEAPPRTNLRVLRPSADLIDWEREGWA